MVWTHTYDQNPHIIIKYYNYQDSYDKRCSPKSTCSQHCWQEPSQEGAPPSLHVARRLRRDNCTHNLPHHTGHLLVDCGVPTYTTGRRAKIRLGGIYLEYFHNYFNCCTGRSNQTIRLWIASPVCQPFRPRQHDSDIACIHKLSMGSVVVV